MEKRSGRQPLGLLRAGLAFALSAAMGVAFLLVVNKTHDLLSSAVFADDLSRSLWSQEQSAVGKLDGKVQVNGLGLQR